MFDLEQNHAACQSDLTSPDALVQHGGYCIGVTRRNWGIDSLGPSALVAYRSTPRTEIHNSDPLDVPEGAICYGLHGNYGQKLYTFGHAWIAGRDAQGYTTDYGGVGRYWLAPMALPRWTGVDKVTWTSWTPFGRLPVGRPHRAVLLAARLLSRHQLHVITLVRRGLASAHQRHVVHVWRSTGVWSE